MKTFEFSIVASGLDPEAEDFADCFFIAGCDDATLSFRRATGTGDFSEEPLGLAAIARWIFKNRKIERDVAEIVRAANAAIAAGQTHLHDQLKKRAKEYEKELEVA